MSHAVIITVMLLLAERVGQDKQPERAFGKSEYEPLTYYRPDTSRTGNPSLGRRSGGGEEEPTPATRGFFAPHSSTQLAPPRLLHNETAQLPVPDAILDSRAPSVVEAITKLGIPWMPSDTGSAGSGKDHGIGSGKRGGMGDREGPDAGSGESGSGPYSNVVTLPACNYCPYPTYTDEARHVKVQGTVTLMVLVGPDGRTADIRVVKGLGYGLDDRAVETVRGWRFVPGRDATKRAVPAWVTVEAVFRLF